MKRLLWLAPLILWLLGRATPCLAGNPQEVVAKGRAATAFIKVETAQVKASGSGFCVHKSGLFVTNAHVVEAAETTSEDQVTVIINSGSPSQKVFKAKLLWADPAVDLALLKVETKDELATLELGKDELLKLTDPITAFGFPFGERLAIGNFPAISANPSRITSLKVNQEGRLEVVQFDGKINPGNSGGPVLDADGRVVGVSFAGIRGAMINFAIPVGRLAEFIATPCVTFEPAPIPFQDRLKPASWKIKVQPSTPDFKLPADLGVSVSVSIGGKAGEPAGAIAAKALGNGEFLATVVPYPPDSELRLEILATINGRISHFEMFDAEVQVGDRKVLASDLRQIIGGDKPRAITTKGLTITGRITGFPKVKAIHLGKEVMHDLDKASLVDLSPKNGSYAARTILATVEAKQANKVLARIVRRVKFLDMPGASPSTVAGLGRATPPKVAATKPNPDLKPDKAEAGRPRFEILDAWEHPLSSGISIRPPSVSIGEVKYDEEPSDAKPPLQFVYQAPPKIGGVAISPDGRQFLVGTGYTASLLDIETGNRISSRAGSRKASELVRGVAFLPDGVRGLCVSENDDTLQLWNLREPTRALRVIPGHTADPSSVVASGDGTKALTGSFDKTARLWELATGRELKKFVGHTEAVLAVALLPDGKRALTSSADGTVRLWELETARELGRFDPKLGPVSAMASSPDGRLVLAGFGDGTIRVWDHGLNREVGRLDKHEDGVNAVVFTHDGRRAISAGGPKDHTVRVWDITTSKESLSLRKSEITASCLAISADGHIVTPGPGGRGHIWKLPAADSAEAVAVAPLELKLPGKISNVAIGGGGRYLLLVMKEAGKLSLFDVNAAEIVKTISLASPEVLVAAGADTFVIAYPVERLIQRWDLATMTRDPGGSAKLPIEGRLLQLALGGDSNGPILAGCVPEDSRVAPFMRFSFLSLDSLKVLKVGTINGAKASGAGAVVLRDQANRTRVVSNGQSLANVADSGESFMLHPFLAQSTVMRASPGGGLFTLWNAHNTGTVFQTLQVKGNNLASYFNVVDRYHVLPGPDGRTIYTGRGGRRDADDKTIDSPEAPMDRIPDLYLPTTDPAYFLVFSADAVTVRASGDGSVLCTLHGLEALYNTSPDLRTGGTDFSFEKRFHLVPSAKLLVTIPRSDDRLVLRRIDLDAAIGRLEKDYLLVLSPNTVLAKAGETLEHQIVARSKSGKVRFELVEGPAGLQVQPDGKVTFLVPDSLEGGEVTALITASDGSGLKRFHKLMIRSR